MSITSISGAGRHLLEASITNIFEAEPYQALLVGRNDMIQSRPAAGRRSAALISDAPATTFDTITLCFSPLIPPAKVGG
jgi:hypothetical protein